MVFQLNVKFQGPPRLCQCDPRALEKRALRSFESLIVGLFRKGFQTAHGASAAFIRQVSSYCGGSLEVFLFVTIVLGELDCLPAQNSWKGGYPRG